MSSEDSELTANDAKPTLEEQQDFMTYCWDELCSSYASDFEYDDKINQRITNLISEHLPRLVEETQYKGKIDKAFEIELHEQILQEVKEISWQREEEDECSEEEH